MRLPRIAAVLASAQSVIGVDQQSPLKDNARGPIAAISNAPAYRTELLSLHKSLVSIPSITGDEGEVGNFLVEYLTGRGYAADIQFIPPREGTPDGRERFNVVAWRGPGVPDQPRLLVTSHIDVVPPYIPYGIEPGDITRDTMIKGRGSVDAKGSVAAMIFALDGLLDEEAVDGGEVMLLFVVGEETGADGMRAFSRSLENMKKPPRFEAAIFGEPTENKLACGHKGAVFCNLTAQGIGGHSGYPWLGKSANEVLVRALAKITDMDLGSTEAFGNTTVNIGRMSGGVAANVIPENAYADLAVRVAIGPEDGGGEIVMERMRKVLAEVDEEALSMKCYHSYGVVECNCDVDGEKPRWNLVWYPADPE